MSGEDQQQGQNEQRDADQDDHTQLDSQEHDRKTERDKTLSRLSEERKQARERAQAAEARIAELEAAQREADEAQAKEQGQYKELLEQREAELAALKQDLNDRVIRDKRAAWANEHNLPADALEFVTGDDDEAIEASVKKLTKLFARNDDLDTDSGKRSATGKGSKQSESLLASYEFGKRR